MSQPNMWSYRWVNLPWGVTYESTFSVELQMSQPNMWSYRWFKLLRGITNETTFCVELQMSQLSVWSYRWVNKESTRISHHPSLPPHLLNSIFSLPSPSLSVSSSAQVGMAAVCWLQLHFPLLIIPSTQLRLLLFLSPLGLLFPEFQNKT